ncbi:MAG: nucleoside-diphosphate kinase [Candidatus Curtissbacteria bacterium]|nr:nucleoside-diphosphate kinase [Candidatus Curtissbacteria bacterium]
MQRTVVLLKPDTIQRGLIGEIIGRLEKKGLKLVAMKMMICGDSILDEHYAHHKDKPFFASLKKFMMSAPLVCMLWEGLDAVDVVRKMTGATNGRVADLGSIRGDLSNSQSNNLIHVSDSAESAQIEETRFFEKGEVFDWKRLADEAVYGEDVK